MEKYSKTLQVLPETPNSFNLWTDGSCWHVDRIGSYACIIEKNNSVYYECSESRVDTTISRMELIAVISGLEFFQTPCVVQVITDSEYVAKGSIFWLSKWKRSGWKIKNYDLWKTMDHFMSYHDIYMTKIKGHSKIKLNEMVDKMCTESVRKARFG